LAQANRTSCRIGFTCVDSPDFDGRGLRQGLADAQPQPYQAQRNRAGMNEMGV
jgi:hypothetical protein